MDGLTADRLRLRRWRAEDGAVFHRLNSDPDVMHHFGFRRTRAESDAMREDLNRRLDAEGMSFLAVERLLDARVLGMVGLIRTHAPSPLAPEVEIGWRLLPEAWGQGYATEAARRCLRYGLDELGLTRIVSWCVVDNLASEAVMRRIGMVQAGFLDNPSVDAARHPHLVRHKYYVLEAGSPEALRQDG
ncbi:GNAT family N-acetyltransferase [Aureimonas frigidaquae]|uniref:GNAT family N-acetyltransferase n=1 Tax=Aureimonas frigidaquae TaxID=424757 RepID=UPI0009FB6A93|nr:GNAT family N-acetyltransferase [Aureimonas frigidaquae]